MDNVERFLDVPKIYIALKRRGLLFKIILVLVLPLLGSRFHEIVYLALVLWALRGPKETLEALSLSWLVTFLNPGMYTLSGSSEVLRWLVLFSGFCSIIVRVSSRVLVRLDTRFPKSWCWLLGFFIVTLVLSCLSSYAFDVSLFKLIAFLMAATTVILGFNMTRGFSRYWTAWFLTIFVVVVLCSLPLLFHPIGFFCNQRGFQGLLNQPQAYGVFLGSLCSWLFFLLMEREKKGLLWWAFLCLAFLSLVATNSRTGMLCLMTGPLTVIVLKIFQGDSNHRVIKKTLAFTIFLLIILLPVVVVQWNPIKNALVNFTFKGSSSASMAEAFYASRGFLIMRSFSNFLDQPLTGIGFGVASDPDSYVVRRNALTGLPLGAPIEKGFLPAAVLEEIGITGTGIFLIFLTSLLYPTLRRGAKISSAVLAMSALFMNFGESVFFSPGGMGLWMWLLIGAARVMAGEKS